MNLYKRTVDNYVYVDTRIYLQFSISNYSTIILMWVVCVWTQDTVVLLWKIKDWKPRSLYAFFNIFCCFQIITSAREDGRKNTLEILNWIAPSTRAISRELLCDSHSTGLAGVRTVSGRPAFTCALGSRSANSRAAVPVWLLQVPRVAVLLVCVLPWSLSHNSPLPSAVYWRDK
jgi:hypothetical protein